MCARVSTFARMDDQGGEMLDSGDGLSPVM